MKKFTAMVMVALIATLMVFAQGGSEEVKEVELSRVQAIIKEAEGMTLSELAQRQLKNPTERHSMVLETPQEERQLFQTS